uniref:Uncharacterized protein n=6 Tax=Aegilops tauschii subsp. strangulata TaxID=200361 RepID=A0A453ETL4_AEGTS
PIISVRVGHALRISTVKSTQRKNSTVKFTCTSHKSHPSLTITPHATSSCDAPHIVATDALPATTSLIPPHAAASNSRSPRAPRWTQPPTRCRLPPDLGCHRSPLHLTTSICLRTWRAAGAAYPGQGCRACPTPRNIVFHCSPSSGHIRCLLNYWYHAI